MTAPSEPATDPDPDAPTQPPHPHITRTQLTLRTARLRARAPRYLALAALATLSLLGLRDLLTPHPDPPAPLTQTATDAPAEDFALQFARAYLTYDAARPEARQRALAPYLPSNLDPDAGFAPRHGTQQVLWTQIASNQEALAGGRLITITAQTTSQPAPVYLAVPVRRDPSGLLSLSTYPSLVGAPPIDRDPEPPTAPPSRTRL